MPIALQVVYPIMDGTKFDFEYYTKTHMPMVREVVGQFMIGTTITKGLASGPDTPPGFHLIATHVFADQQAFDAGMAVAGPVLADIPNFTNVQPQMLIGEVLS
jgi:uncharacterized protein (TIGR02118 family)